MVEIGRRDVASVSLRASASRAQMLTISEGRRAWRLRVRIEFLTCVRQASFAPRDGEGTVFSNGGL